MAKGAKKTHINPDMCTACEMFNVTNYSSGTGNGEYYSIYRNLHWTR